MITVVTGLPRSGTSLAMQLPACIGTSGGNGAGRTRAVRLNILTHTWMGDLIATLTHLETSTTVDLFRRVRFPIGGNFGDGTNLNGTYNFNDAFTGDLWAEAESLSGYDDIPSGDYFPTGAGSPAKVPMLTTMGGLASNGTWRLTISDNAGGDTGSLGSWALNLQVSAPTPVPGPLPLLGAGAAFGWSRRLRKRSRAALEKAGLGDPILPRTCP